MCNSKVQYPTFVSNTQLDQYSNILGKTCLKNNKSDDVVTFLPTKLVSVLGGDGPLAYLADDYQVIGAALGHLRVALNLRGGSDGL